MLDPFIASKKTRIAAFLIDHFVLTSLIVLVGFTVIGPDATDKNNPGGFVSTLFMVMIPGFLLYFIKDSIQGISIGKWIMGIMVRDSRTPNEIPSFSRLLLRNLLIPIWPVEFIALVANEEKQRIGDKIAKTIVVKNPNNTSQTPRIVALIAFFILFFFLIFLFVASTMKNSEAYKTGIQGIEKNEIILGETGGIIGYGMIPTGSIEISNGDGKAQLEIKVLGKKRDINVKVNLIKKPNNNWEVLKIDI